MLAQHDTIKTLPEVVVDCARLPKIVSNLMLRRLQLALLQLVHEQRGKQGRELVKFALHQVVRPFGQSLRESHNTQPVCQRRVGFVIPWHEVRGHHNEAPENVVHLQAAVPFERNCVTIAGHHFHETRVDFRCVRQFVHKTHPRGHEGDKELGRR